MKNATACHRHGESALMLAAAVKNRSTSDYWKPFYFLMEDRLPVMLVNARRARNIPGRKTDVSDASWLAQLAAHGLLRASFVPPEPVRQLRDQCILAFEPDIAGTDLRVEVIQRTRRLERFHTLTLHTATLLTFLRWFRGRSWSAISLTWPPARVGYMLRQ